MTSSTMNTVTITTFDDQTFSVSEKIAKMMGTVKHMMEDLETTSVLLGNFPDNQVSDGEVMRKIIAYCENHVNDSEETIEENAKTSHISGWDKEFIDVGNPVLFSILNAANFLEIKSLVTLCCKKIANMMRGHTPEEIRQMFKLEDDLTAEEKAEIAEQNQFISIS